MCPILGVKFGAEKEGWNFFNFFFGFPIPKNLNGPILTLPYHYWSLRPENEGLPNVDPNFEGEEGVGGQK